MEPTDLESDQPLMQDEARAHVARLVASSLKTTITAIETAEPFPPGSAAAVTRERLLIASRELHDSMLVQALRFEHAHRVIPAPKPRVLVIQ